jgi:hypothetical protein
VTVNHLLCPNDRIAVIIASEGSITREMTVGTNDIGAILCIELLQGPEFASEQLGDFM